IKRCRRTHGLSAAISAFFDLNLALRKTAWANQDLIGNPNQVSGRKFGAGPLIEVVIEHLDLLPGEVTIELLAGGIGIGRALLQVEDRDLRSGERRGGEEG